MAEGVVDPFQAVQVREEEQHLALVPFRNFQLLGCEGQEAPPVVQARERIRDGEGQDLRLHFLLFRQIAGHGLKARRLAVLQDQLGILSEPDLLPLPGFQGIFEIGVVQLLDELATEEPVDGLPFIGMDKVQVLFSDQFLLFVSHNRKNGRIQEGYVSIAIRPDDDLARLLHE